MRLRSKAFLFLALNITGIGIYPVMLKAGAITEDVLSFMLFVFLIATAVSFAYMLVTHQTEGLKTLFRDKHNLALLAFAGLLNYGIASMLEMIALVHLPANLAAIVRRSWVLFMIPFIPLVLKLKVNKYQLAGLLLGFVAIYIAFTHGSFVSINMSTLPYLVLLIAAAFLLAVSNVIIKSKQVSLATELFLFNLSTLAFFAVTLPIAHFALGYKIILSFSPLTLSALLFLGLFTYFVGTYFYFFALKVLEPTTIGNTTLLAPFITFGFSYLVFGEHVYAYYLEVAALIIGGVILQEKAPRKTVMRSNNEFKHVLFDISGAFAESKAEQITPYFLGSGRALAMQLEGMLDEAAREKIKEVASQYGCIVFDLRKPIEGITQKELEFIKEILGADEQAGSVLVGIGNPDSVEGAFRELAKAYDFTKTQIPMQKIK